MTTNGAPKDMVNLTVDGKPVSVPKGTNLIEAAKLAGIEIPHYCYHPHLEVVGNCRMCQVKVEGAPKLAIGCHSQVQEGMKVLTHLTSKEVADAQAATLEFILINHPLDCTVCDQAGHCKLQDFHYEYNARPSRFLEEKVHKVKAEPLGPTVMLDGERCIMCTRCIRFCDEVTGTAELGMLNRGDRSVIAVNPGKVLDNPLSGTVVDLCPVGALTHREWRFNTRIWFTKQTDSICPGCSTGCNVKVAVRDDQVVQVKARMNSAVNKEWLCDEGRYGFPRFLPEKRITTATISGRESAIDDALREAAKLKGQEVAVFISPDLLTEEYALIKDFLNKTGIKATVALGYRERALTKVQAVLISPDYAANFRGAEFSGLVSGGLQSNYESMLAKLRSGSFSHVLIIGDKGILPSDADDGVKSGLAQAKVSVALLTDARSQILPAIQVVLPARSILEKSGLLINRGMRLQYSERVIDFPEGTLPEWRILARLAEFCGAKLTSNQTDRESTMAYLSSESRLKGLKIKTIKEGGVDLNHFKPNTEKASESAHPA